MAETKGQRIAREKLGVHRAQLYQEAGLWPTLQELVPDAWHTLAYDLDVTEPKVKVTLYLDRSVARAFQAMGHGYQARINRLLATYITMQAAGVLNFRKFFAARQEELASSRPVRATEEERAVISGRRGVVE